MRLNKRAVNALADAQMHLHGKGLERCRAGWVGEKSPPSLGYHHFRTINALVDAGYLSLYVKGTVAHITDLGVERLQEWREARAGKAA